MNESNNKICDHCAMTMSEDECGAAEHYAVWVDADGETDGKVWHVCSECLDAGTSGGPGYQVVK